MKWLELLLSYVLLLCFTNVLEPDILWKTIRIVKNKVAETLDFKKQGYTNDRGWFSNI